MNVFLTFRTSFLISRLVAEGKTNEQALVELVVGALGIIQKLTTAGNHHEQTTA